MPQSKTQNARSEPDLQEYPETHNIGAQTREWVVSVTGLPLLASRRIEVCGLSDAAEGYCWIRHQPYFSQVAVCYEGEGEVMIDGEWKRCGAGTVFITPPWAFHAYRAVPTSRWGFAWVIFLEYKDQLPLVPGTATVMREADVWPLRHTIEGLYRLTSNPRTGHMWQPDQQAYHWADLICLIARELVAVPPEAERLGPAWRAVDADLTHPWTVDELAPLVYISGEHFRRLCHRQTGRSPMQHVSFLRMQRAATMLTMTNQKVNTIARAVGFSSDSAFFTAFKHWMGVPPALYRQAAVRSERSEPKENGR